MQKKDTEIFKMCVNYEFFDHFFCKSLYYMYGFHLCYSEL